MTRRATKYKTIVETLSDEILSGRYGKPMSFPSVARIVRRFGVAHLTAVKALDELKQMGLIRSRQGAGSYVTSGASKVFGLIVPAYSEIEFFPVLCQSISSLCQRRMRPLLFADTSSLSESELAVRLPEMARSFVEQRVAGVIFHPIDFCATANELNRKVTDIFLEADIPLVLVDCDMVHPPDAGGFDVVGIDNVAAGWQLGRHVLSQGAQRIMFVSHLQEFSSNVRLRCVGVKTAVAECAGADFLGSVSLEKIEGFSTMLKRHRPDAIVCSSDHVAARALKQLTDLGVRVPGDVLLAGVNDLSFATVTSPALTTIHQPCRDIAQTAFDALEFRLANPNAPARRIYLPAPLVVRASTQCESDAPQTSKGVFKKKRGRK